MSEVITDQPVNPYQLMVELGLTPNVDEGPTVIGPYEDGTTKVRSNAVDQATLEATVAAHVADFDIVPPPTTAELQAATEATNRSIVDQRMDDAIAVLDALIAAPAMPTPPAGTMTTAVLSDNMRTQRNSNQANRAGSQDLARIVRDLIRYVRGDFANID